MPVINEHLDKISIPNEYRIFVNKDEVCDLPLRLVYEMPDKNDGMFLGILTNKNILI